MSSNLEASISDQGTEPSVAESINQASKSLGRGQDDTTKPISGGGFLSAETGALSRALVTNLYLPSLQLQEHSVVFYFSLIEGRCKTQALKILNAGRPVEDHLPEDNTKVCELAEHLFVEMSKELQNAGVLPREFAGKDFTSLRQKYLGSFDTILNNIAVKRHKDVVASDSYRALKGSGILFTDNFTNATSLESSTSAFSYERSRAIHPFALAMSQRSNQKITRGRNSSISGLLLGSPQYQSGRVTSVFHSNYRQLSVLGKGGFGCVYKVLDITDDREYAIKKITVFAERLRLMPSHDLKDALLKEVRGLAKLEHRNVVRYFGGWIEWRPAHRLSSGKRLLTGEESSESSSGGSVEDEDFDGGDVKSDIRRRLDKEAGRSRADASANDDFDASILFEDSLSQPQDITRKNPASSLSSGSHGKSMFRKPGDSGSSDDESTEEISRALTNVRLSQEFTDIDEDAHIYIKMSVHPMTLEDYLWPDQQSDESKAPIKHCFHPYASVRILLPILDGVEYIHSQKIVHRDLKPSNIFLSVRDGLPSSFDGSINISNCPDCMIGASKDRCHIIPHIGDFGLIAEIKDSSDLETPTSSAPGALFTPSPLAVLSSRQPGTKFYCPPATSTRRNFICQKLDVFALGVIAFELITEFSTKSERAAVLGNLLKGQFPAGFDEHVMAAGVKGMLCAEREQRWDCAKVRAWLEQMETQHKK